MFRALSVLAVLLATVSPAKADYFVWSDRESGVTLSYPDTWKMINNQQPDDVITVALPSGDDKAVCRVRVNEDGRYKIFPNQYDDEIQLISYSQPFWDDYNANYDQVKVHMFRDATALGKGYGSMELITYASPPDEMPDYRTGILFVSFYDNHDYIAECSAAANAYSKYHTAVLTFAKSIDFKKTRHELTVGNYRDFLKDWGEIEVKLPNAVIVTVW